MSSPSRLRLKHPFKDLPPEEGLVFGWVCPGAVRTLRDMAPSDKKSELARLTDALFRLEVRSIYAEYLEDASEKVEEPCDEAKRIVRQIDELMQGLSELPDDFYHLRHQAIICSKDRSIAQRRVARIAAMVEEKKRVATVEGGENLFERLLSHLDIVAFVAASAVMIWRRS